MNETTKEKPIKCPYCGSKDTQPGKCNVCKREFGSLPLLKNNRTGQMEDLRDIVTGIRFSEGGFFGGFTNITISRNGKGALVRAEQTLPMVEVSKGIQITPVRWRNLLDRLYTRMYLHEWKRSYHNPNILDGNQWELEIRLTHGRRRTYSGSNAYPPYWTELRKLFRQLTKL